MSPIIDATVSTYGEPEWSVPETLAEEIQAATGARWPVWLLAVAVIVSLACTGHMAAAAFLTAACIAFSAVLP